MFSLTVLQYLLECVAHLNLQSKGEAARQRIEAAKESFDKVVITCVDNAARSKVFCTQLAQCLDDTICDIGAHEDLPEV